MKGRFIFHNRIFSPVKPLNPKIIFSICCLEELHNSTNMSLLSFTLHIHTISEIKNRPIDFSLSIMAFHIPNYLVFINIT
uniref:Uncharacterized protein n=1 Tax=Rhizophora mucronata TaxID=61149 RepID=A0A2P2R395_RHIMU